jgi:hypothetical protein
MYIQEPDIQNIFFILYPDVNFTDGSGALWMAGIKVTCKYKACYRRWHNSYVHIIANSLLYKNSSESLEIRKCYQYDGADYNNNYFLNTELQGVITE